MGKHKAENRNKIDSGSKFLKQKVEHMIKRAPRLEPRNIVQEKAEQSSKNSSSRSSNASQSKDHDHGEDSGTTSNASIAFAITQLVTL